MRHLVRVLACLTVGLAVASAGFADAGASAPDLAASAPPAASPLTITSTDGQAAAPRRVVAFEYSEGTYDNYNSQRSTHRTMAISSMAIATVGYLIMLCGK